MAEQNKSSSAATADQQQQQQQAQAYPPQPVGVPYPGAYPGPYPPPPGSAPYPPGPYFAYPPPANAEGTHAENGQSSPVPPPGPYMMFGPPGVVYYPQPPQGQGFPTPVSSSASAGSKPKRKQVKMACTNCAAACKRCDEARPCERCQKYGIADTCIDGQRKERKKGIKRGPYKRKNKSGEASPTFSAATPVAPAAAPAPAPVTTTSAAPPAAAAPIHQVPQFGSTPEGYYPVMYPPYMPHPEGQPGAEGAPPPNGQHPMMPYYIHPGVGGYPPYPYPFYPMIPPPGSAPTSASHPNGASASAGLSLDPNDASKKGDGQLEVTGGDANGKKRPRNSKGGEQPPRSKKPKTMVRNGHGKDKEAEESSEADPSDSGSAGSV